MPHRIFNPDEAASYLHLSRAELEELVRQDQIPRELRGGRVVFRGIDIDAWASRRILEADAARLVTLQRSAGESATADQPESFLGEWLRPEHIDPALPAKTRTSVLREMAALADRTGLVCDRAELVATLEAREALCPTAVPGGVAFLHPRSPQPHRFMASLLLLGRTVQPIHFGSPDGQPTDLFFLVGSQDDRSHLRTLARLCLMAQKTDLLARLRAAPAEPGALLEVLLIAEADALEQAGRLRGRPMAGKQRRSARDT